MATFQWITNSGISDWSVASNWSSASVPGALDSATIGVSGTVTVTVNSAQSVGSLTLSRRRRDRGAQQRPHDRHDARALPLASSISIRAARLRGDDQRRRGSCSTAGDAVGGEKLDGPLDLSANNWRWTVNNGITLTDGRDRAGQRAADRAEQPP